jgi:two-component system, NarL family, response regulator DevR
MEPIRVGIIDDHPIVRDGVRRMADQTPGLEFCWDAADGEELEDFLRDVRPDVLIFDVRLADEDGLALCARVHRTYPRVRILMLSAFGNSYLLQQSVRAGASGYALKDVSTRDLPSVIRQVHEDGTYFDPRLSGEVLRALGKEAVGAEHALNPRETAIIRSIADGMTNREIAVELSLSPDTVKFHVGEMLHRFELKRRSELVKFGFQNNLV